MKFSWLQTKTYRDLLFQAGINPVVYFPIEGPVLWGDATLLSVPSAFAEIGVRRTFLYLEKTIGKASNSYLFEFNNTFTQNRFVNEMDPILADVQGKQGISSYTIICDSTNNTPPIIDTNTFVAYFAIAPSHSIHTVNLYFIATPTGVNFIEFLDGVQF